MNMVSIKQIAAELKVNKDYALRLVKKRREALGLRPQVGKRGSVLLTREDANRLIADYQPRHATPKRTAASVDRPPGFGFFYIIQLYIQKTSQIE